MTTWGLRREVVRDKNGWFYMLWPPTYKAGSGYRPIAGDELKVWAEDGKEYVGTIQEVHSFLYSSRGEVKLALGGVREYDEKYVNSGPENGWCVAVRAELAQTELGECPIEGRASWKQLDS